MCRAVIYIAPLLFYSACELKLQIYNKIKTSLYLLHQVTLIQPKHITTPNHCSVLLLYGIYYVRGVVEMILRHLALTCAV